MKQLNLTQGRIVSSLIKLALPITFTGFVEMAYTLTDMFWIGIKGSEYVSAVGASGNFVWLAVCFIIIPRVGGQVKVAHCIGADDIKNAKSYLRSSLQLGLFIILIFSLLFFFLPNYLVSIFNFDSKLTIELSIQYLKIQAFGIIPYAISLILTGIYTAMGNTKIGLICNGIGLIVNMILDPFFIYILDMDVRGAAIATSISEVVVFFAFIRYMKYYPILFKGLDITRIDKPKIKGIFKIGFPPAIKSGIFAIITLSIGRMIASYGSYAVGVQKVGAQIEAIAWKTSEGLSSAVNAFTAQNYGAKRLDRALKAYKISFILCIIIGTISATILFLLPRELISIFFNEERAILVGIDYLIIMGFSQIFMCLDIVTNGALAGLGYTLIPNIACMLIIMGRIPMALLLSSTGLALSGIWWSITISCILTGLISVFIYIYIWNRRFKNGVSFST